MIMIMFIKMQIYSEKSDVNLQQRTTMVDFQRTKIVLWMNYQNKTGRHDRKNMFQQKHFISIVDFICSFGISCLFICLFLFVSVCVLRNLRIEKIEYKIWRKSEKSSANEKSSA